MDLVERFVEASQWSTAKKTAVMTLSFFLPAQCLQYVTARIAFADTSLFNPRLLDVAFPVFITVSAVVGAAAVFVARRGHEGHWTFYAWFIPYVALTGLAVYAAGIANSVLFFPMVVPILIAAAFFDARKVIAVASLVAAALIGMVVATAAGLEYAPALVDRSIDAYAPLRVQLGGAAILTPALIGSFAFMTVLAAGTRRDRTALVETRDQLDQAVGLISKYVPAELASGLLSGTEGASTGYRRQKVTSFFSDIVGFTELAEEMEPEELAAVLNEYFTEMAEIAERHHGTVDELQGDGLILVFGAPSFRSDREHALDAVRSASEMQAAIGGLNERWRRAGVDVSITVRMGINTGVATVGHFGTGNRLKYTVLGKHVNLAARVQAMCEPGKVLISNSTWLLVKDEVAARSLGQKSFKGVTRPVEVHELA